MVVMLLQDDGNMDDDLDTTEILSSLRTDIAKVLSSFLFIGICKKTK